ncbi:Phospholipid-translocating P-type ATPase [Mycena kentingensis (nom. inval.)]|nr:Phospholipid-translocating P-type ATPase [Mycena kentingensis (nom. inval.)]
MKASVARDRLVHIDRELEQLHARIRSLDEERDDLPLPPDYLDPKGRVKPEHKHLSNQVITSKYTLLTFLPRDLLEQFRRVANVFFLAIAVLQFFPKFSTISPGLVIFPLLVVLTFTACKDVYEDTKRHQSDRKVNHSIVRVLDIPNNNAMKGKHPQKPFVDFYT